MSLDREENDSMDGFKKTDVNESDSVTDAKPPSKWNPCSCLTYDQPTATAIGLDTSARGSMVIANVFLLNASVTQAKRAAGCPDAADKHFWDNCDNEIYGYKPTSLPSSVATIGSLCIIFLLPIAGAIVDYTCYRKKIGLWTAVVLTIVYGFQAGISQNIWVAIVASQVLQMIVYLVHIVVTLAYIPELTNDTSKMGRYNASFNIVRFLGMLLHLLICAGISFAAQDSVEVARYSQMLSTVWTACFMGYAWFYLFEHREAGNKIPEGKSLVTAGFWRIWDTFRLVWSDHIHIFWFYLSIAFGDGALSTFSSIIIALTNFLGMSSLELALVQLIVLVSSFPGSKLSIVMMDKFNPKRTQEMVSVLLFVNTVAASIVLTGPSMKNYIYLFCFFWGLAAGAATPAMRTTFTKMIPKGQEAEFMGTFTFSFSSLVWFPNLIFSVINESNIPLNYGLMSLNIFFLISFIFLRKMGSFERLIEHKRNWEERSSLGLECY